MNVNENKAIEAAEPSIKEWIQAGKNVMLPELYDDYVYYKEDIEKECDEHEFVHQYIIGLLTDKVRKQHNCTHTQALKVVCYSLKDLLEKRNNNG